jgi:hypothetical protein
MAVKIVCSKILRAIFKTENHYTIFLRQVNKKFFLSRFALTGEDKYVKILSPIQARKY